MADTKILLPERDMPRAWYNILADAPVAAAAAAAPGHGPADRPGRPRPALPDRPDHAGGLDRARDRRSPKRCVDVLRLWRPTPLYRAHRLERALGTRSRIYYKYEGVSPAGSHKPNTAVAQAFYNAKAGRTRIATETGAGQWGSAMALACGFFGLECKVYMVRVSYDQKPYRRMMMETWGATSCPARRRTRTPAARCSSTTPTRPAASASPSRRRSRTPPRTTTRATRSARC